MRVSLTHPLLCLLSKRAGACLLQHPRGYHRGGVHEAGAATGSMSVQPVVLGENDLTADEPRAGRRRSGTSTTSDAPAMARRPSQRWAIGTGTGTVTDQSRTGSTRTRRLGRQSRRPRQRVTYLFALLNIVLIWPLWLKVITSLQGRFVRADAP